MTSTEFRTIRLSLGLSQSELGRIMGMKIQHVSRIECERDPTLIQAAFLKFIAKHYRKEKKP
jgi:transcriptional regulator with XRE-family HTH domain